MVWTFSAKEVSCMDEGSPRISYAANPLLQSALHSYRHAGDVRACCLTAGLVTELLITTSIG